MKTPYLAWQDHEDRRLLPVGRLSFDGHVYRFVYTKGAEQSPRFVPFGVMRDLHVVYESTVLFPLFANRLLSKSRPEYRDFLAWLDVPEHAAEPLVLLALTEGMRATDTLMVFPYPEKSSDGKPHVRFFSHGLRYVLPAIVQFIAEHLRPSAPLFLMLDPPKSARFVRGGAAHRGPSTARWVLPTLPPSGCASSAADSTSDPTRGGRARESRRASATALVM